MGNNIGLIVKYSTEAFDEVYKAESRSALLDGDKKLMQFTGAKTVKIAKFSFTGLSDYKRANTPVTGDFAGSTARGVITQGYGYQQADMGLEWEEFKIECDRAAQYRVEMFDNEETAQMAVGMGTTQVNKQVVIPEIDAYAFSKIAGYASVEFGNLVTSDIGTTPLAALNSALLWLDNNEVPPEDQIIFCAPTFLQKLRNSGEVVKPLLQGDFAKNVKFLIEEYEGRPIVSVPPRRFMTNIILGSNGFRGANADDVTAGAAKAVSKVIDFMIVAKSAVYHIVKYNKIKVFGPDVVQDYDGYKINARIYHDVFVPDNKRVAIYVHQYSSNAAADAAVKGSFTAGATGGRKTILGSISILPNGLLTDGKIYSLPLGSTTAGVKVGDALSDFTVGTAAGNAQALTLGVEATLNYSTGTSAATHQQLFVCDTKGNVLAVSAVTAVVVTAQLSR